MNMKYDTQSLIQGQRIRREAEERPATFAEYNGVTDVIPSGNMDIKNQTRMAGKMGTRALELMSNPQAAQNVNTWMEQFGQSNQGSEFNTAKSQQAKQMADYTQTEMELGRSA